ncbi:hypothetical protein VPHK120G1_0057 [Vibrio phage K120 g1]
MPKPNSRQFAKLFEFDDIGQVLVIQDQTDPEVSFKFWPEGFGISGPTVELGNFEDSDTYFNSLDEKLVYSIALNTLETLKAFGDDNA